MKRLTPFVIGLLAIGLPGCDINITDGGGESGETEGAEDTEGGGASTTSANTASGGTGGATPDGTTSGASGDSSPNTSNDESTTADGPGDETGGGPSDETGDSGGVEGSCNDEPDCASCYQCSILPGNDCDDAAQTCFDDPDCNEIVECQGACIDSSTTQSEYDVCIGACTAETPAGMLMFNDLIACRESTCPSTCPGGGTTCDIESADCQTCVDCTAAEGGSCDPFVLACLDSVDCLDLYSCQQDCYATAGSQGQLNACLVDCEGAYPGGIELLTQLDACTNGSCPVSCAG